ncbi:MAG: hypothetical protein QOI56_1957, partial [Actinomycetota bacterium]|nr:hypothetical protein [Actinomycetota bacterium]
MRIRSKATATAVLAGLALLGAACGSDSKSADTSSSATADMVTAIPSLSGVGTSVRLDGGTAAALTSLGVAIAPSGSATFDADT